jgi:hypothetical protein
MAARKCMVPEEVLSEAESIKYAAAMKWLTIFVGVAVLVFGLELVSGAGAIRAASVALFAAGGASIGSAGLRAVSKGVGK